jgi:hypothetical protein
MANLTQGVLNQGRIFNLSGDGEKSELRIFLKTAVKRFIKFAPGLI